MPRDDAQLLAERSSYGRAHGKRSSAADGNLAQPPRNLGQNPLRQRGVEEYRGLQ
jgi:hypothetical protein